MPALKDYTMYGALILKAGDADGFVSGACHSTANTLRPGLQVIKTAPGIKTVSSCFIMVAPEGSNKYLPNGISVFGDCAINIAPNAKVKLAVSPKEPFPGSGEYLTRFAFASSYEIRPDELSGSPFLYPDFW